MLPIPSHTPALSPISFGSATPVDLIPHVHRDRRQHDVVTSPLPLLQPRKGTGPLMYSLATYTPTLSSAFYPHLATLR